MHNKHTFGIVSGGRPPDTTHRRTTMFLVEDAVPEPAFGSGPLLAIAAAAVNALASEVE